MPLPHWLPHVWPHTGWTRLVHCCVHACVQHDGWTLQTLFTHEEHEVCSGAPTVQTPCEQVGPPPAPPPIPPTPPTPPVLPPLPLTPPLPATEPPLPP